MPKAQETPIRLNPRVIVIIILSSHSVGLVSIEALRYARFGSCAISAKPLLLGSGREIQGNLGLGGSDRTTGDLMNGAVWVPVISVAPLPCCERIE